MGETHSTNPMGMTTNLLLEILYNFDLTMFIVSETPSIKSHLAHAILSINTYTLLNCPKEESDKSIVI
jgi:hypothetical protein